MYVDFANFDNDNKQSNSRSNLFIQNSPSIFSKLNNKETIVSSPLRSIQLNSPEKKSVKNQIASFK